MLLAVYKKIGGKTIDEDKIQSQDVENHVGIEQEYSLLGRFFLILEGAMIGYWPKKKKIHQQTFFSKEPCALQ